MTPDEWAAMRKLVAQFIDTIADVRWRVERLNTSVKQKETTMTTGCNGGYLTDPRAYFFTDVIKREEGSPAPDWKAVLESLPAQGMGVNPKPGEIQPPDAPFYGITVMIDAGNNARGRIWLPTATPVMHDGNAWYTHEFQVIAEPTPGSMVWAWIDKGGAPYSPHACDSGSAPGPTPPPASGDTITIDLGPHLEPLRASIAALEQRVAALEQAGGGGAPVPKRIALKDERGKYLCADQSAGQQTPVLANRDSRGGWETFELEVVE